MHGIDILFLAIVAGVLLFRFYNVLGQEDQDTQDRVRNLQKMMEQTLNQQNGAPQEPENATQFQDFLKTVSPAERTLIKNLWEQWPQFNPDKFLKGARKAFVMIVEGFSEGNEKDLPELLSPTLWKQFQNVIETRKKSGEIHVTKVENIRTFRIVDARLVEESAVIVVDIQSFQSYTITDKQGTIIHENKVDLEELWDRWSFSKNITNTKPVWTLVNIESTPDALRKS